jgi:hypothetical protein
MELQNLKNNKLTYIISILTLIGLAWYFILGSNSDYFKGSLNFNDTLCDSSYSSVFSRESIDLTTSLYSAPRTFVEIKDEIVNSEEVQVRVYNDTQSCEDHTVVNCDVVDFIPYENREVFICKEDFDSESVYLLSNPNGLDSYAYYMQEYTHDDTYWVDTVYTTSGESNLLPVDIRQYNVEVLVK